MSTVQDGKGTVLLFFWKPGKSAPFLTAGVFSEPELWRSLFLVNLFFREGVVCSTLFRGNDGYPYRDEDVTDAFVNRIFAWILCRGGLRKFSLCFCRCAEKRDAILFRMACISYPAG